MRDPVVNTVGNVFLSLVPTCVGMQRGCNRAHCDLTSFTAEIVPASVREMVHVWVDIPVIPVPRYDLSRA
eukprot:COSAG02_NODE_38702_length_426_cov_0.629969_1_plen_69_part_10